MNMANNSHSTRNRSITCNPTTTLETTLKTKLQVDSPCIFNGANKENFGARRL